ncbi:RagB/SusD family nutrient uptake outer membrane protein [Chitinophaga sp. MM2321]|uniref:RagB/SusD family nutrient uptake outer membrane protein n=1 Tax=Chitinophaga sp. MM2321 TaxID=3137178 RepID=UPI0032D59573
MKRYYLFLVLILLGSCKKALERNPLDSLTPDEAFSSEENLQLYINSFYSQMIPTPADIYGYGDFSNLYIGDKLSDIITVRDVSPYLYGVYSAQQATGWTWTTLRNVNYFLANYQKAPVAEARKNHYAGIARFFRAWFYYNKVKQFGDVPWYSQPLSPTDEALYKAKDPRTLVMDSVLADINFACENIDSKKDNTCSAITKWVALALKSRICLYEGTYRKYHTELSLSGTAQTWLQNAAESANQIMTSGTYSLNSTGNPDKDYRTLFVSENPPSSEVMLASISNNTLKKWHVANWTFTSASLGPKISFVKRFINTYLNIDGTRFTDGAGYATEEFQDEVKNRDKRLSQTIRLGNYKRSDGSPAPPDFLYTFTGYHILKFTTDDKSLDGINGNFNSIPIIRYAEVLLNYAEAKAELGTFSTDDWNKTIALLRQRAGITNIAMPTTIDAYMQANFFDDISSIPVLEVRRERGIELAGEGLRYDDLKRWKKGKLLEKEYDGIYVPEKNKLVDLNEDGVPDVSFVDQAPAVSVPGVVYVIIDNASVKLSEGDKGRIIWRANIVRDYADKKYYAPIPFNELVLNKNLVQNDGWDHP